MPPAAYVYVLKFFAAIIKFGAELVSFMLYLRAVQVFVVNILRMEKGVLG